MVKILKNIRVVELGTYITGPAAAMHLGDLGADVIKVERPGKGDPFRAFKGGLYSPHYQTYNRNKRSIALDTKNAADLKTFYQLIATADVFIQNFRPGVAEKLGVGEHDLRKINPKLVYCAISGFGQSGPSRDRPAYDTVAQAASGYLRLLTPPSNPGLSDRRSPMPSPVNMRQRLSLPPFSNAAAVARVGASTSPCWRR
jgi:crotonobetainyl-CoA:carnitine CoA-transferase CaiB-like acyl-CoA transferase